TVQRRKTGRSFTYTPTVGKDALRSLAVKELVDSFFDGSVEQLFNYLNSTPNKQDESSDSGEEESYTTNSLETELL
ncbi:MAG TPA: BlaI/MecI/CopY family transcriptional regulator, partial [Pyrinomonadaceae bacterium]